MTGVMWVVWKDVMMVENLAVRSAGQTAALKDVL